jgi:predicted enzyme related to lactoylglutathione lyase
MKESDMNINGIMIGTADPAKLKTYYTKLFGKPTFEDESYFGWQMGSGSVMFGFHDQVKGANREPGRVLWNIETADVKGEFEKLKKAGATVVKEPYSPGALPDGGEMWIATLADPDNNYFQLMSPMTADVPASSR